MARSSWEHTSSEKPPFCTVRKHTAPRLELRAGKGHKAHAGDRVVVHDVLEHRQVALRQISNDLALVPQLGVPVMSAQGVSTVPNDSE
jgi:hypothetical protein